MEHRTQNIEHITKRVTRGMLFRAPCSMLRDETGFTLLEIIMAVAIVAILATVAIIAINPEGQFAKARDGKRLSDLSAILNAMGQNIGDNNGTFSCSAGSLPTSTKLLAASGTATYNIAPCLVPAYMEKLPYDPLATSTYYYTSVTDYNTGYTIIQSTTTGRITLNAPSAELDDSVSVTR